MVYFRMPTGASTVIVSPSREPMSALPSGESSEILLANGVGLGRADDGKLLLGVVEHVIDAHLVADGDLVGLELRIVEDGGVFDCLFQLRDFRLDFGLLVFASSYSLFSERSPNDALF